MQSSTPLEPGAAITNGDGSELPTRTAELGQKAADAIDARRETVARGIDAAAASLQARADRLPGEKVASAARKTAQAMESAADYVREQDVRAMLQDVRQATRRHPGAVLLAAVALGFMLARALRR
jgi:acyl-CoA reductase-like NAD-dependent aldehyde dehydrogenase